MKMMPFLAAGAAAATLAVPSSAAAAPGWELPQVSSFVDGNRELPNTTYATRCGSSQYGVYRFTVGVTERGVWGAVRFRALLTADGARHAPTRVRFVGRLSRTLERQTRDLLRSVQFGISGDLVQTVFTATGQQQATMPFAPRPRRC
jgi:hypothetical protein